MSFLLRDKTGVNLAGSRGEEELGGVEKGKIHFLKKGKILPTFIELALSQRFKDGST